MRTRAFVVVLFTVLLTLGLLTPPASAEGVDGVIDEGEYELSTSFGDGHFELYWQFVNDTVQIGLVAKTTGWIALGIDPEKRMKHADMLIGWWEDGTFELHDTWSVDETGPHPDDTDLGGTFDILTYFATQGGGKTTVEFTRALSTGDQYDKDIPETGVLKVLWATSDNDNFNSVHSRRGKAEINVETGETEAVEYPTLWPIHATLMTVAVILFISAVWCVENKKKLKKRYVNIHHNLAQGAVGLTIAGLVVGWYMVAQLEEGHIRVAHSWFGLVTIVLGLTALGIGSTYYADKKKFFKTPRKRHMFFGGTTIILIVATVIVGLMYVFP
jgi:hypothetical protein